MVNIHKYNKNLFHKIYNDFKSFPVGHRTKFMYFGCRCCVERQLNGNWCGGITIEKPTKITIHDIAELNLPKGSYIIRDFPTYIFL